MAAAMPHWKPQFHHSPSLPLETVLTHGLRGLSRVELVAPENLRLPECPFVDLPNCKLDHFGEGVTPEEMTAYSWLKPELELSVAFNEWNRAGSPPARRAPQNTMNMAAGAHQRKSARGLAV